jgi:hypothetical protein
MRVQLWDKKCDAIGNILRTGWELGERDGGGNTFPIQKIQNWALLEGHEEEEPSQ